MDTYATHTLDYTLYVIISHHGLVTCRSVPCPGWTTPPTRNCLPLSAPPRHSHLDALEMIASDLLWAVVVAHVLLPWPRHASTSHTCIRTHKHTPAQCHLVRELGRHHQRDKNRERGKGEKETREKKAKTQKDSGDGRCRVRPRDVPSTTLNPGKPTINPGPRPESPVPVSSVDPPIEEEEGWRKIGAAPLLLPQGRTT